MLDQIRKFNQNNTKFAGCEYISIRSSWFHSLMITGLVGASLASSWISIPSSDKQDKEGFNMIYLWSLRIIFYLCLILVFPVGVLTLETISLLEKIHFSLFLEFPVHDLWRDPWGLLAGIFLSLIIPRTWLGVRRSLSFWSFLCPVSASHLQVDQLGWIFQQLKDFHSAETVWIFIST